MSVINNRGLGRFWPISWTITQFWGRGVISTMDEPRCAFTCRSSTLGVLPDSGPFHGLSLTVLGPGAISTIDEPRGAFMCRSSIILVFPIPGSFMDYYSPFWGPRAISTIDDPRGAFTCPSSTLSILADSGVPGRFPRLTNTGVRLCVGHQHSWFCPILCRFMDYYSLIWGP